MMRTNSKPSAQTQILIDAIRDCGLVHRNEVF
jgi:hypothetical protein